MDPYRKTRAAACALLLVVLLAGSAVGCGGGVASEASQYIENGEEIINRSALDQSEEQVQELSGKVFGSFTAAAEAGQPLGQDTVRQAEELLEIYAQLEDYYKDARAEFEKVAGLDDVEDYKTYAQMQISSVDLSLKSIAALKTSVETALAAQTSADYDAQALIQQLQALSTEAMNALMENDALRQEMDKFSEEKGL